MHEINQVKESIEDQFISLKSVNGVGVGQKWVNGEPTEQPAILVFVQKKHSINNLVSKFSASELIPKEIDGIPTDIIEVGDIVKQNNTAKMRPIVPGYSISHQKVSAGTLGGIFIDKDGDPVILSNNHVAACENNASPGDLIYQPGTIDSRGSMAFKGWTDPPNSLPYFATLKDFVRLTKDANNQQDSAIAKIHSSYISAGMINTVYPTINKAATGFATPSVGMQVQKIGRTTGYTTGQVIGLNSTFTVAYDFGPGKFTNCVVCSRMSAPGDSGSCIMNMDNQVVALLFAGSDKITLANPIDLVVNRYGLKIYEDSLKPIPSFELDDGKWQTATVHGQITYKKDSVEMTAPANAYCVIQRNISKFKSIRVTVNTGTDNGMSWGPGLSLIWPTGVLKINLRKKNTYCATLNGVEKLGIGKVKPNKEYVLRVRKEGAVYIGEVMGDGVWTNVITVPESVLPGDPTTLLIGKTNKRGNIGDFSSLGATGTCTFRDLDVVF